MPNTAENGNILLINAIERFLDYSLYERENPLAENTIAAYRGDLLEFAAFCAAQQLDFTHIDKLSKKDIHAYKRYLRERTHPKTGEPLSIKTVNRRLMALSRLMDYLNECENHDIRVKIRQEKVQYQNILDDMVSNNDVVRILRAAQRKNDWRAKAIVYTLFFTGARVSEMLQIKAADIGKDEIMIRGKGSKYRKLFIPDQLQQVWLGYTDGHRIDNSPLLFTGTRGPINRQTVANILKYYAGQARVKKSLVHAHALRHLYTKNLAEAGVSQAVIKQLLGHQLSVTDGYMQVSKKDLLQVVNGIKLEGIETEGKN